MQESLQHKPQQYEFGQPVPDEQMMTLAYLRLLIHLAIYLEVLRNQLRFCIRNLDSGSTGIQ